MHACLDALESERVRDALRATWPSMPDARDSVEMVEGVRDTAASVLRRVARVLPAGPWFGAK